MYAVSYYWLLEMNDPRIDADQNAVINPLALILSRILALSRDPFHPTLESRKDKSRLRQLLFSAISDGFDSVAEEVSEFFPVMDDDEMDSRPAERLSHESEKSDPFPIEQSEDDPDEFYVPKDSNADDNIAYMLTFKDYFVKIYDHLQKFGELTQADGFKELCV